MSFRGVGYETWVVTPLFLSAVVYYSVAFIPVAWLPARWASLGYPSDLFLLLDQRTTVTTHVLRDALMPQGALNWLANTWAIRFGEDAIERLLWRLSSVDGRKLYLVLGAEPILACSFCTAKTDCVKYALYLLLVPYVHIALVLSILTVSPRGVIPRIIQRLSGRQEESNAIVPHYSRAASRRPAMVLLALAFACELYVILRADELGAVYGRWEHWHANCHLLRYALFLLLLFVVYSRQTLVRPATEVIETLRALSSTSAKVDMLMEHIKSSSSPDQSSHARESCFKATEPHIESHASDAKHNSVANPPQN